MAEHVIPHFHNTPGVPVIEVGAHEFMCVGEKPPFDHPQIFIDMGEATEAICPYCSTLFREIDLRLQCSTVVEHWSESRRNTVKDV